MQFLLTIFSRPKQKVKRSRSPPRWKNLGHDPFNQNFQKSRSKTEWISSVQPEKFRKSQSTFEVDLFSQLGRSDRKLSIPFDRPILNPSTSRYTFYVQHGGKHLSVQLLWIVNSGDQCYSYIHGHLQQVDSC